MLCRELITADNVQIVSVIDDSNGGIIVTFFVQTGSDVTNVISADDLYEAVKVRGLFLYSRL